MWTSANHSVGPYHRIFHSSSGGFELIFSSSMVNSLGCWLSGGKYLGSCAWHRHVDPCFYHLRLLQLLGIMNSSASKLCATIILDTFCFILSTYRLRESFRLESSKGTSTQCFEPQTHGAPIPPPKLPARPPKDFHPGITPAGIYET